MLEDHNEFRVIGEAADGRQACEFCRKNPVDIVLMDMRMPGMDGLEATRRITRVVDGIPVNEGTRVIALTGSRSELIGSQFLQAGAAGFLSKNEEFADLVRAIRSVANGRPWLSDDIAQRLALRGARGEKNPFDELTQRELQICLMIADCQKVSAIADNLHVIPKTVNTYRYRIFEKLGVSSDVEMTLMAIHCGVVELGTTASG